MNTKSARKAAEFVRCCEHDKQERLTVAMVPGHEARLYQVTFSRNVKPPKLIVEACVNVDQGEVCNGHKFNLCFHAIAALIHAAKKKGMRLTFCATKEKAERIARTGGTLVEIVSKTSNKGGWIVYRPRKSQPKKEAHSVRKNAADSAIRT